MLTRKRVAGRALPGKHDPLCTGRLQTPAAPESSTGSVGCLSTSAQGKQNCLLAVGSGFS